MSSRDTILGRIREALRQPAPRPGHQHGASKPLATDAAAFRQWLPHVGPTWDEQCQLFAQNAAALKAEFKLVPTPAAAAEEVRRLATAQGWKQIGTHANPLTDAVCKGLGLKLVYTDRTYATADLEQCDGGVSTCEALIAQTGSVLVTSRANGGRALSVLPHHHVVLATRDQLLPDLPAAFAHLRRQYDGDYPSLMSFITGPSRTGDIERILVLGAHGPKQLTVLLIGE